MKGKSKSIYVLDLDRGGMVANICQAIMCQPTIGILKWNKKATTNYYLMNGNKIFN